MFTLNVVTQYLLSRRKFLLLCVLGGILFVAISLAIASFWPWGADYFYHFYPLAEQWVRGDFDMFDGPGVRLFYPPWSMIVIGPLGLLPLDIAHGFLLTGTIVLMVVAIRIFQDSQQIPTYSIFLALCNLHSFDLFIRGQIDAVVLLGVVLGFWAVRHRQPVALGFGFCLMAMKPPLNVALPALLYLISIRAWTRKEWAVTLAIPLLMVLVFSLIVGLTWPLDFVRNVEAPVDYLSISLWRGARLLGLPQWPIIMLALPAIGVFLRHAWQHGTTPLSLSIALATNMTFTFYANGDHYILLIPALIVVIQYHKVAGLLAYALTWTPLLRLAWGANASPLDVFYPLMLLATSYLIATRLHGHNPQTDLYSV